MNQIQKSVEAETFVDMKLYNRVASIRVRVHEMLRDELRKKSNNILWSTETIETTYVSGDRRCEDRLLVKMKVNIN